MSGTVDRDFLVVRRRPNLVDIVTPKRANVQGYRLKAALNFDGTFNTMITADIGSGYLDSNVDRRVLHTVGGRERIRIVFDPNTFSGAPWNLVDDDHFWLQFFPVDFTGAEGTGGARVLILPDDEMKASSRVIIAGTAPIGATVANSLRLDLPARMQDVHIQSNETGAVAATGTLTLAAVPGAAETVVIDGKTYTFTSPLGPLDGDVLIGGTASDSIDNLIAAITLDSPPAGRYAAATTLHPSVTASAGAGDTMIATAKIPGSAGNSITTTETLAAVGSQWGALTLLGGVDSGAGTDLMVATTEGGPEVVVAAGSEIEFNLGPVGTLMVRGDGSTAAFSASMTHYLPL